jgi:tetratricopeptide (TPR) repeat protein
VFAGSTGTISNIGVVLAHLRYTRIAEREADGHALRILKGSGIAHRGLGDFFERINGKRPANQAGKSITDFEVIRTHPLTTERITLVRAQPAYPATPALSPDDWKALRDACGVAPAPQQQPPADTAEADREIADATKTLEANPNDVAALQKRARAYGKKRQHELALTDLTMAVQLKPEDAALLFARGFALQGLRRYEEALADYDAALRLAPNHLGARNARGNTNRTLKRYEVALTDFDDLIRYHPKFASGYYNRALVYLDLKRPADAVRDFSAAIAADKDYAGAYTQRGLLQEKTGAREPAVADFRAALAAPPKYDSGQWAHRTAREHLKALGVEAP